MTPEEAQTQLEEYRVLIDEVDRRIVALLNERTQIVENIGRVKRDAGLPVYEPKREDQVFANITSVNHGPLTTQAVRGIFERIIDAARSIQRLRMTHNPPEEHKCKSLCNKAPPKSRSSTSSIAWWISASTCTAPPASSTPCSAASAASTISIWQCFRSWRASRKPTASSRPTNSPAAVSGPAAPSCGWARSPSAGMPLLSWRARAAWRTATRSSSAPRWRPARAPG